MQRLGVGAANIHSRPPPYRIQPFQNLDVGSAVAVAAVTDRLYPGRLYPGRGGTLGFGLGRGDLKSGEKIGFLRLHGLFRRSESGLILQWYTARGRRAYRVAIGAPPQTMIESRIRVSLPVLP